MTIEELKDVMKNEDVRSLEIRLQQGKILKSNIGKIDEFYSFEFLVETKYARRLIAGSYREKGGIHYICDMSMSYAQAIFDWARSE